MPAPTTNIPENIRVIRVLRRMTQEEVADAMRARGHSTWTKVIVSRLETGLRHLRLHEADGLASVLECRLGDLTSGPGETFVYGEDAPIPASRVRPGVCAHVDMMVHEVDDGTHACDICMRRVDQIARQRQAVLAPR